MNVDDHPLLVILILYCPELLFDLEDATREHTVELPPVLFLCFLALAPPLRLHRHLAKVELFQFHLDVPVLLGVPQEGLIVAVVLRQGVVKVVLILVVPTLILACVEVFPLECSILIEDLLPLAHIVCHNLIL